jgi:hypothetical protein
MRRAAALILVTLVACASSPPRNVQIARQARYDIGIAVVYATAVEAVQSKSKHVEEDATAHRVRTAWSAIGLEQAEGQFPASGGGAGPGPPGGRRSTSPAKRHPHAYRFVRVDLEVVGDRPYEVRITGHASLLAAGARDPEELSYEPPWLTKYLDDIRVAIYERLQPYAR